MSSNKCKNCESFLFGKYCSNCGQKKYYENDKSLKNIISEAFHFFTNFDGKIFNTLKAIYVYPGKLSLDYSEGIRQKYYKPISFYLLIVILYLLFPIASGMNMEMKYYKSTPVIGTFISNQIEKKIHQEKITEEILSKNFNEKSKGTSKFLLLLLIPLQTPLIYILYNQRKRYFFDNFILLSEINIFFLLTFFILIPLMIFPFFYFLNIQIHDQILFPISYSIFCIYSIMLFHRVFVEKWWISIIKGIIFSLLFMMIILTVYRPLVFEVTFALI